MSTTKTVDVTTNKVLHYTVEKEGYKTVSGSKLVTADTTINVAMTASSSSSGPYTLGDRLAGCATFFCYFNSTHPVTHTAQKLAVFVVDAKYRTLKQMMGNASNNSPLPDYDSVNAAKAATESSTYNTQTIIEYGGWWAPFYYARNPGGSSLIIKVEDNYYAPALPNASELQTMYNNRSSLDTYDPTIESYPGNSLVTWGDPDGSTYYTRAWCSNEFYTSSYGYQSGFLHKDGSWTVHNQVRQANYAAVFPVIEIPVN